MHVCYSTNRPIVSLQPINTEYSRDADERDEWTRRWTSRSVVSVSSCAVNKPVACVVADGIVIRHHLAHWETESGRLSGVVVSSDQSITSWTLMTTT